MVFKDRVLKIGGWKKESREKKPSPRWDQSVSKDKKIKMSLVHAGKPLLSILRP